MKRYVLDASVAAKWFLPAEIETLSEEALSLLRLYAKGEIQFVVPDLFWAEFGNILWKAERQGRCARSTADEAVQAIQELNMPTTPSRALLESAFGIASEFGRTVYDSLYIALGVHSKGEFITADERLVQALSVHLPVKWLGSAKLTN